MNLPRVLLLPTLQGRRFRANRTHVNDEREVVTVPLTTITSAFHFFCPTRSVHKAIRSQRIPSVTLWQSPSIFQCLVRSRALQVLPYAVLLDHSATRSPRQRTTLFEYVNVDGQSRAIRTEYGLFQHGAHLYLRTFARIVETRSLKWID